VRNTCIILKKKGRKNVREGRNTIADKKKKQQHGGGEKGGKKIGCHWSGVA